MESLLSTIINTLHDHQNIQVLEGDKANMTENGMVHRPPPTPRTHEKKYKFQQHHNQQSERLPVNTDDPTEEMKTHFYQDEQFHDSIPLTELREKKAFSDVKILIPGEKYLSLHKIILSSRCEYFKNIFLESDTTVINLKGIEATVFTCIIDYLYTGKLAIQGELLPKLYKGAAKLHLHNLCQWCKDELEKQKEEREEEAEQLSRIVEDESPEPSEQESSVAGSLTNLQISHHSADLPMIKDAGKRRLSAPSPTIMVLGGCKDFDKIFYTFEPQDIKSTVQAIDLGQNKSQLLPNMPGTNMLGTAVVVENVLFYLGGCSYITRSYPGALALDERHVDDKLYRYDRKKKTWVELCSMLVGVYLPAVGVLMNQIVVFGGKDVSLRATKHVQCFDPELNRWKFAKEKLPSGVSGAVCCVIDNAGYISGGLTRESKTGLVTTRNILQYKVNFEKCGKMLQGRASHMACTDGSMMYILGGCDITGKVLQGAEMFDPQTGQSSRLTYLPWARLGTSAIYHNDHIYIAGGRGPNEDNPDGRCSNDTLLDYDIKNKTWICTNAVLPQSVEYNCGVLMYL